MVFLWCNMNGICDESVLLESLAEHVNWTHLSMLSCSASDYSHSLSSERTLKILPMI